MAYVRNNGTPAICYVGGEDLRMRIPLLLKLKELGFNVYAIGSEPSKPFEEQYIPYFRYNLSRGIAPFDDRRSKKELVSLFAKLKPDVVHAFDTKPALIAPAAAITAGVKYNVRTITGMGYVYSTNHPVALFIRPLYRKMQRNASYKADITIFQNTDDMSYFVRSGLIDPDRAVLIKGSGVDIESIYKRHIDTVVTQRLKQGLGLRDGPVVTMIARLVKYKGVVEYLKAARIIKKSCVECNFLLIGPHASEGAQAVSLKTVELYSDAVKWLGQRSDVYELLSITDVFVLPSYYREGVPRVLLEAAAMGVPLITTDMPGCRDVVRNGREGLLVRPRDIGSLVKAITTLLNNPSIRMDMGQQARSHVETNFSLQRVAHEYASIYSQLLRRGYRVCQ